MIVRGTTPRRLTWGGTLALLALGVLLLPAAFAQEGDQPPRAEEPLRKLDRDKTDQKDVARARAAVDKLKRELDGQLRRLRATEDRLRQAAARLGQLTGKGSDPRRIRIVYPGDTALPRRPAPPRPSGCSCGGSETTARCRPCGPATDCRKTSHRSAARSCAACRGGTTLASAGRRPTSSGVGAQSLTTCCANSMN